MLGGWGVALTGSLLLLLVAAWRYNCRRKLRYRTPSIKLWPAAEKEPGEKLPHGAITVKADILDS